MVWTEVGGRYGVAGGRREVWCGQIVHHVRPYGLLT